jgi:hypothetical protein
MINVYEVTDDKSERKKSLGGLRRKFKGNIEMCLEETGHNLKIKIVTRRRVASG